MALSVISCIIAVAPVWAFTPRPAQVPHLVAAAEPMDSAGARSPAPISGADPASSVPPLKSTTTTGPAWLWQVNLIVSYTALAMAMGLAAFWLLRYRRDPLAAAPLRPNNLREEGLAAVVVVYLVALLSLSLTLKTLGLSESGALATIIVGNGSQVIGIAACLVIASGRFEGGARRFLLGLWRLQAASLLTVSLVGIVLAVGLCPLILEVTMVVVRSLAPGFEPKTHATLEGLREPNQPQWIVVALWAGAAVVAPIAEEMFFRGLIQTYLARSFGHCWGAIVVSALLFGAVHSAYPHTIPALVFLGMLLGYAYERTGSLLPPLAIHGLFNLKTLVWDALS